MSKIERLLYKCCQLRGNPPELIHRTIHEFDFFITASIWGLDAETEMVSDIYKFVHNRRKPKNPKKILLFRAKCFYDWCRMLYEDDDNSILDNYYKEIAEKNLKGEWLHFL